MNTSTNEWTDYFVLITSIVLSLYFARLAWKKYDIFLSDYKLASMNKIQLFGMRIFIFVVTFFVSFSFIGGVSMAILEA